MWSLSFNFCRFFPCQPNIKLLRDASIANNVLRLTREDDNGNPQPESFGLAFYSAPLHLGERAAVASFKTTFTFRISSPSPSSFGDGLAFVIATRSTPDAATLPRTPGRFFSNDADKFVAVAFVTHPDPKFKDPIGPFVGVFINDYVPWATARWNPPEKATAAEITYDPGSKRLSVVSDDSVVNCEVDLGAVFPDPAWVVPGFAARTGPEYIQTNEILSWSFESNLPCPCAV